MAGRRVVAATELGVAPSLLLDVIRLGAAIMVVVGHLSQARFSTGWPDLTVYAVNAVTAFFLLSGFVIRYVTVRRSATLTEYLIDRGSRIDSVLLPALLLSLGVDALLAGRVLPGHLLAVALANLTFTAFSWHHAAVFASNSAMWSLCFECVYYLLYGVFFYASGWRRALLLVMTAVVAGPEILALLPVWLAGCALFQVFLHARQRRWCLPTLAAALAGAGTLMAANASLRALLLRARLSAMTAVHGWESPAGLQHTRVAWLLPRVGPGSHVSVNAYVWAVVLFVLLLLGLLMADRCSADETRGSARVIRLLAEATFPLYLVHLPVLFLVVAVVGHPLHTDVARVVVLLAILVLSAWLGVVCNRWKMQLRAWLLRGEWSNLKLLGDSLLAGFGGKQEARARS